MSIRAYKKILLILALFSLMIGVTAGMLDTLKRRQEAYFAALFSKTKEPEGISLTEEEVADLTKSSVVRIYHKITGEAKIPSFTIDLDALEIKIDQRKIRTVPIDYEIMGSGVIVSPSGFIATNAHVASPEMGKFLSVLEVFSIEFFKDSFFQTADGEPSAAEQARFERAEKLAEKELKRLVEESSFDIVDELKILDPSSKAENLEDITKGGFPAQAVYTEQDYIENDRDISILKIEESRLPALPIETRTELPIGRTVFAFGFPATAEVHKKDLLQASFTRGIINALKSTEMGEFKLYQLDAKISQGSSGGPLLDEKGNIKGLITSQTSEFEQERGDNFAFAIPSPIVKDALDAASIEPAAGAFYQNLLSGIESLRQKRCKVALTKFEAARDTHGAFLASDTLGKYIAACERLIESGKSIDSRFDETIEFLKTVGPLFWLIIGVVLIGGALGIIVIAVLKRRVRHTEESAAGLSQSADDTPKGGGTSLPGGGITRGNLAHERKPAYTAFLTKRQEQKEETVHTEAELEAIKYAKTELKAGYKEDQIIEALKASGWQEEAAEKIMLLAKVE
ncbi:MAG: hypothetical protein A2847_00195 [Candidatus Sungbacteria bacterium RIFCSPHIGHO2_01_FULL_50_25]|uniref:Uncharacterized protein n=1 Tax=Candidatus Sungbacteria bacterium RIFCSPHIGHO2_01_FULL_50_25 TaxID=1802265 RepID=A0A1G2KAE9_9BACT|nr:MAG: hypothetical protein A2847_00195 [Candidatus Sungbacteria bacterium RIFCSPHIGHO2_01_FULL_50_25]